MAGRKALIPAERIERAILLIQGHKVILDSDLAVLYGVTTFNLNKAVKRNIARFPDDFMFQLTGDEGGCFEIPIWNVKSQGARRPSIPAVCIHRARVGRKVRA